MTAFPFCVFCELRAPLCDGYREKGNLLKHRQFSTMIPARDCVPMFRRAGRCRCRALCSWTIPAMAAEIRETEREHEQQSFSLRKLRIVEEGRHILIVRMRTKPSGWGCITLTNCLQAGFDNIRAHFVMRISEKGSRRVDEAARQSQNCLSTSNKPLALHNYM